MSDVFISYKREDKARVEILYALLLDLDVSAWFERHLAGVRASSWRQDV